MVLTIRFWFKGKFEDNKGVTRGRISIKKRKKKRINNEEQNNTQKTRDKATRTPLKPGMNSGAPEG